MTAEWYEKQDPERFVFYVGEAVTTIDTEGKSVTTDKGRVVPYDYCVIATGSNATVPSYVDTGLQGVFVYRNISDLNRLLEYAETDDVKGSRVRSDTYEAVSLYIEVYLIYVLGCCGWRWFARSRGC